MAALVFSMSTPVEIVLVQHSLHLGAGSYGALVSAWGAGSLAGSAGYARWRNAPTRTLVCVAAALLAVGFVLMAIAWSLWLVIVGAAVAGVGNGVEVVAARTALQEEVEQEWMALIMILNESVFTATPGLGIIIGGGLAALAGPRLALGVAAGGSLVIVALAWELLPRRGARVLVRPRPAREGIPGEPDSHPEAAARR
jgi:MFS family permease